MKKYLLLFLLGFALNGFAQTAVAPTTKLDKDAIVKDAEGNVIPYIIWSKLMQSGEYSVRLPKNTTEFLLYKMNEQEKVRAAEAKKARMTTMNRPKTSDAFKDGEKFKGEKMSDINGIKYDLKTSTDKIYVINFWFINCPPCRQEMPELNELVAKYKDNKDVVFLAIALDDRYSVKEFLKTKPFNYNIIADGNYYADKYDVKSFPTHVIIGKDGLVKFSTLGLASNTVYWVEKTIKEQLAGT